MSSPGARTRTFPLGAAVDLHELDADPHAVHHRLRPSEPVSWLPCLDGWLVTSHALALRAMHDAGTFTVDDPRFTTARVIGPSMLSLDGDAHARHRAPFVAPFRAAQVHARFADPAADGARALLDAVRDRGHGEMRRGFAGPLAAGIVTRALGMSDDVVNETLSAYDAIVASVTAMSGGHAPTATGAAAYARLCARLQPVIDGRRGDSLLAAAARDGTDGDGPHRLPHDAIASNAAVLLFGGIETTEGMIANAALQILTEPGELERLRAEPTTLDAAIDESLRREPAAAVVDRYATTDTRLGDADITRGELVRISIAAANRDPSIFEEPDRWSVRRLNLRRHLAFAHGPHVCVGVHLARLEARAALTELLALPGLRVDPAHPAPSVRGLVFRKPTELPLSWERPPR